VEHEFYGSSTAGEAEETGVFIKPHSLIKRLRKAKAN
jgi:hypothetical protein